MFIKKGINKAAGKNIYPHPNQTETGNCAAYAAAACLYAFGLDHESGLIPPAEGAQTDREKFQHQITKMIERLQGLIYYEPKDPKDPKSRNSMAEALRKYINEKGLNCKFDVSEPPPTVWEWDSLAGERRNISNIFHMMDEMRRCQDIIMNVVWTKPDGTPARHAVGLVGGEGNTLVINNPWGTGVHTNPDDAATNTAQGQGNGFTSVPMTGDDKGNITIPIGGNKAQIYQFLMVCPAKPHQVAINSHLKRGETPGVTTIDYELANVKLKRANGLAIELRGFAPENVVSMTSPTGWKSSLWYREQEPFDRLAPEIDVDPEQSTFAGVLWRTGGGGVKKGKKLSGFSVDLRYPKLDRRVAKWRDDKQGHGIVLEEDHGNTCAWHINALTPVKEDLKKRFREELRKRSIKPIGRGKQQRKRR